MTGTMSGQDYSLLRCGRQQGPSILWIHGYTMNAGIWRPHWEAMPHWRHLAVDMPGHGRAPTLRPGQTLEHWVDGLVALAQAEDVCHVVALSFGGLVALSLAARMGPTLHSMVLNSPAVPGAHADPSAQACSLAMLRQFGNRGRGPWLTETWLEWPHAIFAGMRAHPQRWETLRTVISTHGWMEIEDGSINRMVLGSQLPALARAARARALLVGGENDMDVFKRNVEVSRVVSE